MYRIEITRNIDGLDRTEYDTVNDLIKAKAKADTLNNTHNLPVVVKEITEDQLTDLTKGTLVYTIG